VALWLDELNSRTILLYVHFLACFLGLAYLPFSKMFHIFATPISQMANAVMVRGKSDPASYAVKQIMELDGCMHCGACTLRCSVAVAFQQIPNVNILPSEKIASIKRLASGKKLSSEQLATIQQGMYLCTNCHRCTDVCPAGINLQELWTSVRDALTRKSLPEPLLLSPLSLNRALKAHSREPGDEGKPEEWAKEAIEATCDMEKVRDRSSPLKAGNDKLPRVIHGALAPHGFSNCFRCVTCSNVCPVVRNYRKPMEVVGLMPHQIMHAVGLQQWDLVFSARMLWDCLGCYQCQENCPMNVHVADILYELKHIAIKRTLAGIEKEPVLPRGGTS
jgi:heterodisulfide reductase subunit C